MYKIFFTLTFFTFLLHTLVTKPQSFSHYVCACFRFGGERGAFYPCLCN